MQAMTVLQEPADEAAVGIQPVPPALRRLRAADISVLWGDLAVGVLVLAAGALLVAPAASSGLGMDLRTALVAIVIGSAAGSLLLALVGLAGHDRGVPTMTLLRPVLGRNGSYGASVINVTQLVGWTSFEFWAMALLASRVSRTVSGVGAFHLWLALVAIGCIASALLGPIRYVQLWLERAGIWIVLASCGFLTVYLLTTHDVGHLLSAPRHGARFAVGVDLVVAQPVSWLPLVADYNRFAAGRRQNFIGTFGGYTLGNMWFYALGALLVLTANLTDASPAGIAASILGLSAGTVVAVVLLTSLLAGETHEAFADIYSAAVSAQNVFPRLPNRAAVVVVGAVAAAIAALVTLGSYEAFLFLLGSVFIPLFAVLLADWAAGGLRRRQTDVEPRLRPGMVLAWATGFAIYHWIVAPGTMPTWWTRWVTDLLPHAGEHTGWGASLPCFAVTFVVALAVSAFGRLRGKPARRRR
jgi:NCS1 family nucleobase:cation symporter-1